MMDKLQLSSLESALEIKLTCQLDRANPSQRTLSHVLRHTHLLLVTGILDGPLLPHRLDKPSGFQNFRARLEQGETGPRARDVS